MNLLGRRVEGEKGLRDELVRENRGRERNKE